jgi:hypothetical protein
MKVLFIIGAPRSGTNILRDCLSSLPGFYTLPCDEVNHIYRHFTNSKTDCFAPEGFKSNVFSNIRRYIFRKSTPYFDSDFYLSTGCLPFFLEKTCANCLRIPFLQSLFPDAKYLYIRRNPLSAINSAYSKWVSPSPSLGYLASKSVFSPKQYLISTFFSYFNRYFLSGSLNDDLLRHWGPSHPLLHSNSKVLAPHLLVALQWFLCTSIAESAFASMSKSSIYSISYEDFVLKPIDVLSQSISHLRLFQPHVYTVVDQSISSVVQNVHARSVHRLDRLTRLQTDEINKFLNTLSSTSLMS